MRLAQALLLIATACSAPPDHLRTLGSLDDVAVLAGARGEVKWLASVDGVAPREPIGAGCLFQDTERWPFHLIFLQQFPESEGLDFDAYVEGVLRRPNRFWWGGEVHWSAALAHPITGQPGTMLYSLYTEDTAGNRLVADDVRQVDARMRECVPFASDRLAFAPQSNEQIATATMARSTLAAEGIAVVLP